MSTTTQNVALKGPAGLYGRADEPNTGPWAGLGTGWRAIVWDKEAPDASCTFTLSKPDSKFQLLHVETNTLFGADATKFSGDLGAQFYLKPADQTRGAYESPVVYDGNLNGMLTAQVEYQDEHGKYVSCAVAVEVLS